VIAKTPPMNNQMAANSGEPADKETTLWKSVPTPRSVPTTIAN